MGSLQVHGLALFVQWGVVIGASLAAAIWDAIQRRVPNRLTAPVGLIGLIWSVWTAGPPGLGDALVGSLVMTTPFVLLFIFAGGGAGDAKLMGALGTWLGMANGLSVLLAVCGAGVLVGLAFALARGHFLAVVSEMGMILRAVSLRMMGVRGVLEIRVHDAPVARTNPHAFPYAIAIFVGVLLAAGVTIWHT